jgi:drug/metabolite transporter (DMT)-like permease
MQNAGAGGCHGYGGCRPFLPVGSDRIWGASLLWLARQAPSARTVASGGIEKPAERDSALVSPRAWFLPLVAGLGYALGVMVIRRSLTQGVSAERANLACNGVMALLFQLFWVVPCTVFPLQEVMWPILCGTIFFLGQILTFRTIAAGDVSVSTPLMGTKVLFVALFTVLIARTSLPEIWWWSCLMASSGIALISYDRHGAHQGVWRAVLWSLAAAAVFALTDLFVQLGVPRVGYPRFAPIMFGTMGVLSLVYLPAVLRTSFPRSNQGSVSDKRMTGWLIAGAAILALQSLAMYSAIGLYGSATLTNILYGSRCLWGVLLAWLLAVLMHKKSGVTPHRVMGRRMIGAILLVSAMALVLSASRR